MASADVKELPAEPLEGKALLQKIKDLSNLPRREKARRCGYYRSNQGGTKVTRVNLADFYDAVLRAMGTPIDPNSAKDGRGREPTYRVSVHQNGQIVIGATYTKKMNLEPGAEFDIRLGYKHIHLVQVDEEADGTVEEE